MCVCACCHILLYSLYIYHLYQFISIYSFYIILYTYMCTSSGICNVGLFVFIIDSWFISCGCSCARLTWMTSIGIFRVDTSRHGSVPETTRQKVNIWGLLDGQFLRARPHDQQPFWGWFTPAISGYFWFVGRFMAMHHTPRHLRLVIYQEFVYFLPVR